MFHVNRFSKHSPCQLFSHNTLAFCTPAALPWKSPASSASSSSKLRVSVRRRVIPVRAIVDGTSREALESYVRSFTSGSDLEVKRMNVLLEEQKLRVLEVWLLFAARVGDATTVESLIGEGANPNVADSEGSTPLMRSISRGHADVAKVLLGTQGIDVYKKNDWGYDAVRYLGSVRSSKPDAHGKISNLFRVHGIN